MYDMTQFKKRFFDVKLQNGRIINIEPPTLKTLKKIVSLSEISENSVTENDIVNLREALVLALNKNKQGYKVSGEKIENEFTISEIVDFLSSYFQWVNEINNEKN